ncbi:MAG TPA: type I DNA topoisomerase, partial [Desulfobacteraceae bacterium]|nr:type I DNA topoisomerase [Desulfobacteraceae bacterium]
TSFLQQEAFNRLRFSAKKTMSVAQSLYEGIELGNMGQTGLITYMRTDSFRISDEAVSQARDYISKTFGSEYIPARPNFFKSRKGAQEAHEAIRPTSADLDPKSLASYLTKDQLSLYSLIWKRFLACQMTPAILDQTKAEIIAGKALFNASGSAVVFKGYTALYEEGPKDSGDGSGEESQLPPLKEGQNLKLIKLDPAQHFTQPPPRFTEATLIKALESNGIGRPSTYAAIIANISGREYVILESKRFKPTELGFLVTDLLVRSFPEILSTEFTAQMEDNLDRIETGEVRWNKVLKDFHDSFHTDLEKAAREMKGEVLTDISCEKCGKPMAIKSGRNGLFLACTGYPECRNTMNYRRDEKGKIIAENATIERIEKGVCDKCGKPQIIRNGKFGHFVACSGYPECKNIWTAEPVNTNVPCPNTECPGMLIEKTSKRGRKFYSCNQYPSCSFAMWDEPVNETCPECGTPVLAVKSRKGSTPIMVCRKRGCTFSKPVTPDKS